jgi:integrase/recombinase XerD
MATMSSGPLRRRMIEDMTLRNLSPSTQQSYVYAVANFSRHFGRSPDKLGLEQVRAYQLHLIGLKRSWTHINQVTCALRFFYAVTLGRKEAIENIISAREPIKQPLVLSAEEVARFLEAVPALRDRVALVTAYAAGLRVGEVSRLKPSAIDSKRMLILITGGKGGKDRYVMLSQRLLSILRSYWCLARPRHWLFPGRNPDDPAEQRSKPWLLLDRDTTVGHDGRPGSESAVARLCTRRTDRIVAETSGIPTNMAMPIAGDRSTDQLPGQV